MEIDITESGGFWLPSVPLILAPYAQLHPGEVLWVTANGSLRGTAEENGQFVVPRPVVMRALLVRTIGEDAQPDDGDLLITVRKNGENTALWGAISRGSDPGHTYMERSAEVYFAQGDLCSIKVENLAGADSVIVGSISIDLGIDHRLQ